MTSFFGGYIYKKSIMELLSFHSDLEPGVSRSGVDLPQKMQCAESKEKSLTIPYPSENCCDSHMRDLEPFHQLLSLKQEAML